MERLVKEEDIYIHQKEEGIDCSVLTIIKENYCIWLGGFWKRLFLIERRSRKKSIMRTSERRWCLNPVIKRSNVHVWSRLEKIIVDGKTMMEKGTYVYLGKKISRDGALITVIKRSIVHGWAILERLLLMERP